MFIQILVALALLVLVLFILFSWVLHVSLVFESNFLPTCCWFSTSHIIFSYPTSLISGIPNGIGSSSCATNNLPLTTLSFCVLIRLNKCLIVLCLNCFTVLKLLSYLCSCVMILWLAWVKSLTVWHNSPVYPS